MTTARSGDHEIYYEVHGSGGATPAVLIMGLGADAHGWERQVPTLSVDRRVVVLDNRGVGRSAKPRGPYTTALLADDVAAVLDAAGVDVVHAVGLSLGGMIAQELALRHPRRLRSLALVATFGKGDSETHATAERGAQAAGLAVSNLQTFLSIVDGGKPLAIDPKQLMAFLMPLVFSASFLDREREYLRAFYERSLSYGFSIEGFAGQVAAVLAHDALDRLRSVTTPTLVVTGTKDRLVPARHSRSLAATIPGSRLIEVDGATHGLNFERADEVNAMISGWWRETD